MTSLNEEHPQKAKSPIDSTEELIDICFNEAHSLKAEFIIKVAEEGIKTSTNDKHLENAESPIDFTVEGIDICVNYKHPAKIKMPIESISENFVMKWRLAFQ